MNIKNKSKALLIAMSLTLLGTYAQAANKVRVFYIIPSEKSENPNYAPNIIEKIQNVQNWYTEQVGTGYKFELYYENSVKKIFSTHNSNWFYENPMLNTDGTVNIWTPLYRSEQAVAEALGIMKPSNELWLIYTDITLPCKNNFPEGVEKFRVGGGLPGLTVMGSTDLKGLNNNSNDIVCEEDEIGTTVNRWIGGTAHELGHAFGLSHIDYDNKLDKNGNIMTYSCDDNTCLMYGEKKSSPRAFENYPNTKLMSEEKNFLKDSGYFSFTESKPNAVSNVSSYSIKENSAGIHFKDNSENETGFKIYANGYLKKTLSSYSGIGDKYVTLTGLNPSTNYTVDVHSYNSDGLGDKGNTISFKTAVKTDPLATYQAAPTSLYSYSIKENQISLHFNDNSQNEYGWQVYLNGVAHSVIPAYSGTGNRYVFIKNLSPNKNYNLKLKTYNKVWGGTSSTIYFKTKAKTDPLSTYQAAPTSLYSYSVQGTQISLHFKDNSYNEYGWQVYVNGVAHSVIGSFSGTGDRYVFIRNLRKNTNYNLKLKAYNKVWGGTSSTIYFKTRAW